MDHSVPLFLLIIDYICFNATPITLRHYWAVMVIAVNYLVINLVVCKTIGPVYPQMTWSGVLGITLPFIFVGVGTIAFYGLTLINKFKFFKLGYTNFIQVI